MARNNQDWDDLGRNIQDIIDRAVNAQDYQKLNQTIRQVVDRAVDLGGDAVRKVVDGNGRPAAKNGYQKVRYAEPISVKKELPVLYGSTGKTSAKGIVKIVGGSLLSGVTVLTTIASLVLLFVDGMVAPAVLSLIGLGGGMGLIGSGVGTLNRVSRFKAYRKALGEKTHCALEKLARSVGKNVKFVKKEVQKMIADGLFLEGHLDKEETSLIVSDETYRHYEQSRLQFEERKRLEEAEKLREAAREKEAAAKRPSQVQEVLDRGNAFIREIRRCNDAIPGEEISAKIDRMELIVRRIFERAEAHPEVVPDLKKMMDYYLPMTVKLLNAYADMDAQPVQGETIQASKREIEDTLDTLNLAFEKLLDDLFEDTAMDVSSDISVLKTLLAQEGLAEDDLSRMKKERTL